MISPDLKQILDKAPYRKRVEIGPLPGAGEMKICAGQLIEVLGEHYQGWLIRLFKEIPNARVGWICKDGLDLCPIAMAQEKIPLSRFLFLDQVESKDGLAKVMTFIKSGLFQLLVFEQSFFKIKTDVNLRKLQLLAEEYGTALIMRSLKPTGSFSVQIQVETANTQSGTYIKLKGGNHGR